MLHLRPTRQTPVASLTLAPQQFHRSRRRRTNSSMIDMSGAICQLNLRWCPHTTRGVSHYLRTCSRREAIRCHHSTTSLCRRRRCLQQLRPSRLQHRALLLLAVESRASRQRRRLKAGKKGHRKLELPKVPPSRQRAAMHASYAPRSSHGRRRSRFICTYTDSLTR